MRNGNLLEVIHQIYGLSVVKNMLNLKAGNDEFQIEGFIGKIEVNRANSALTDFTYFNLAGTF